MTLDLNADGTKTDSAVVSGDAWTASFTDLPKYDYENATWPTSFDAQPLTPITYTVKESKVGDAAATTVSGQERFYLYSSDVSVNNEGSEFAILGYFTASAPTLNTETNTYEITNTFTPATEEENGDTGFYVLKVDENGDAITSAAAEFKLVNAEDGSEIGTASTSTTDGKAKFGGLSEGKYTLTEETAPTGYVKDDTTYTITINQDGRVLVDVDADANKNIFQKVLSFLAPTPDADWNADTLTLTVANTAYKPVAVNPPVQKKIEGVKGSVTDEFTFTFKPVSNTAGIAVASMPMPDGSANGQKQITKPGAGEYEFGEFELPLPGTYVYQMSEESGDLDYEYDSSTYTVTYVVTANGAALSAITTITQDGEVADGAVFTNVKNEEKPSADPEQDPDPAPDPNPDPIPEPEPVPAPVEKAPLLTISKTSNVKEATAGSTIPYTLTIANTGEGDATGVEVVDTMGDALEYVSDNANGVVDGKSVTWVVDVAAGQTLTIGIECKVSESAAGKVVNSVLITPNDNIPVVPQEDTDEETITITTPDSGLDPGEGEDDNGSASDDGKKDTPTKRQAPSTPKASVAAKQTAKTADAAPVAPLALLALLAVGSSLVAGSTLVARRRKDER